MENIRKYLGIKKQAWIPYGYDKAKVSLSILKETSEQGKLILVTALNPTPAGEGKTTVSIGLAQGLKHIGKKVVLALREPSLGPVFGLKGGATGGGVSSIEPQVDINLHFTGDLHAITSAHNLLSALIDAHIFHGNDLKIKQVLWPRTLDMNDRSLRTIQTKLRDDRFVITAASEVMAILALATSYADLIKRLGNILIGNDEDGNYLYVKDLKAEKAMAILLKDALNPNIVKTKDGVPAFVHAGPFANIAHGCNSVVATKMALQLSHYTVTEAGFGADLGMEKFLHLKMPHLNKEVDCVVLVATIRALKSHGNSDDYNQEDVEALKRGLPHLAHHVKNIKSFGIPFVIALNHFDRDTNDEIDAVFAWAKEHQYPIELSKGFKEGGLGTIALAQAVIQQAEKEHQFKRIYEASEPLIDKITKVATAIYGARGVVLSPRAKRKIERYTIDFPNMPICMAKTPLSLSDDPKLNGLPLDFDIHIDDVTVSNGAGFIVCLTKGIMVMPGLNKDPRALHMDFNDKGDVIL